MCGKLNDEIGLRLELPLDFFKSSQSLYVLSIRDRGIKK